MGVLLDAMTLAAIEAAGLAELSGCTKVSEVTQNLGFAFVYNALGVPLDIRWSADERFTHRGKIAAGKFVELCGKLPAVVDAEASDVLCHAIRVLFRRRLQVLRQSERPRDARRGHEKAASEAAAYLFGLEPMPEGAVEGAVPDSRSEPVLPSPSPPDMPLAPDGSD